MYFDPTLNRSCMRGWRLSQIVAWQPNLRGAREDSFNGRLEAIRRGRAKCGKVIFLSFELSSLRCFHFQLLLLLGIGVAELE